MDMNAKKRLVQYLIAVILIVYSIVTIIPFYFVAIRTFVPTSESMELHLWVPPAKEFDMNARFGDMAVFYNLDIKRFKKDMSIKGYIDSQLTINEIADNFNIPKEKLKNYFQPFYLYNGWYVILTGGKFLKSLFSTVWIVIVSIILGALLSMATGSVLARFRKKWHLVAYNLYMLSIIIPTVMIMLPLYIIVVKFLHLDNNYLSIILLNIQGGAFAIMLFTNFIAGIPLELKESVEMDGGNRLHYFFRILIPLSKVAIATYVAIRIPSCWNDLIHGFLFLKPEKYTLVPMLSIFSGTYTTNYQAICAGLILSITPLTILYLCFQKLFVKSMISGAIKG